MGFLSYIFDELCQFAAAHPGIYLISASVFFIVYVFLGCVRCDDLGESTKGIWKVVWQTIAVVSWAAMLPILIVLAVLTTYTVR